MVRLQFHQSGTRSRSAPHIRDATDGEKYVDLAIPHLTMTSVALTPSSTCPRATTIFVSEVIPSTARHSHERHLPVEPVLRDPFPVGLPRHHELTYECLAINFGDDEFQHRQLELIVVASSSSPPYTTGLHLRSSNLNFFNPIIVMQF